MRTGPLKEDDRKFAPNAPISQGNGIETTIKAVTLKATFIAINRPRNLTGTTKKHTTESR